MERNLQKLARGSYDLVIVGGGIYGAAVAWEAVRRGLSVCLVEKSDFSSATSANSLKIIHGGLRYLQHADLRRMRESNREQQTLMRIAPHLIRSLPVLIPTYGHGIKGKEILSLAVLVNRLIGCDLNLRRPRNSHAPLGRTVSRQEVLQLLSGIRSQGLTGGVIFYDAQVHNSERLLFSFLRSAGDAGADVANYVEVTGFLEAADRVLGVQARDVLTGERFDVQAKTVVVACGPWVDRVVGLLTRNKPRPSTQFAKAINLVTRPIFKTYAVGIFAQDGYRDADAWIHKANRLLFFTPWRGRSLIGTEYFRCDEEPDNLSITGGDIDNFLDGINRSCPAANLKRDEIAFVHRGLVPVSGSGGDDRSIQPTKHYQIRDHGPEGAKGLISVIGVKYTTARDVAEKVVDHIFHASGQRPPKSDSSVVPLHGGDTGDFDAFLRDQIATRPSGLGEEAVRHLVQNYGSAYREVLRYLDNGDRCVPPSDSADTALLEAEVRHGIRAEMAQTLADVIFRRTEMGSAGHPGGEVLRVCADVMSAELAWDASRKRQEIHEVQNVFSAWQ
ncbi:MAG: glycerol-3-phosphate dehydrogenase/oxidase [Candidatus Binatia bacterium]